MATWKRVFLFLVVFFSLCSPVGYKTELSSPFSLESYGLDSSDSNQNRGVHGVFLEQRQSNIDLEYDYYREMCPNAEMIVRATMNQIFSQHKNAPGQLLRLLFHDCFIEAGGPFYPLLTGRRDSTQSFFDRAKAEIPRSDGNSTETLHLFALRGFNEREIVTLLGGHNIGKIGFEFMEPAQPDPTISSDFINEKRLNCQDSNSSANDGALLPMRSRSMSESTAGMSYYQGLSSSISSGYTTSFHVSD